MPFLIVREKNQPDRRFAVAGQEILIGRSQKCDLVLANVSVSRHHASLLRDGSLWRLQDLKSGNGTLVNGTSVEQGPVKTGDQINMGKFSLIFYESEEDALMAGTDISELTPHNPLSTAALDTSTFQIPTEVLKRIRDSESLLIHARILSMDDESKSWTPGEEPLQFGARNGPPVRRMLSFGTAAILSWSGTRHEIKRTSLITGLWVNGQEIEDRQGLNHGDTVEIGGSKYSYIILGKRS